MPLLALAALIMSTAGCVTGHVSDLGESLVRTKPERLSVASSAEDGSGTPFGVVATEAFCRVAPGDPEGGPGAAHYTLVRAKAPGEAAQRLLDSEKGLELLADYRADPEHPAPPGFPDEVLVGLDGGPALYVKTPLGWTRQPVTRFEHTERQEAHPYLAALAVAGLTPFALAFDVVTLPVQWLLVGVFPIAPH